MVQFTAVAATIHFGSREAAPGETIDLPEEHAAVLEEAGHGHRDAGKAKQMLADRQAKIEADAKAQQETEKAVRDAAFADAAAAREKAAIERAKRVGAYAGVAGGAKTIASPVKAAAPPAN